MSGITLTAGVRQNLLSLQSTADMMSSTQNRLATGKKVNSALDNPSNFFTSSSLNDRAGDLSSLLDSIGQATKTLDAANNGITSLTKLVQSAKSTAQQARQASATANTYAAVSVSGAVSGAETLAAVSSTDLSPVGISLAFTTGAESVGAVTATKDLDAKAITVGGTTMGETLATTGDGTALTLANTNVHSFSIDVGAGVQTVIPTADDATPTFAEALANAKTAFATAVAANSSGLVADVDIELVANSTNNGFKINALKADVDFTVTANSGAGLPAGSSTYNSTSLLDNVIASGGASGNSLTIGSTGNTDRTVTFSATAGANNVSTLAELNTWLGSNAGTGVTASATAGNISFAMTAGANKSLTLTASTAGAKTALGLNTAGTPVNLSSGANRGGIGAIATELTRTFSSEPTLSDLDPTITGSTNLVIALDKGDGTTTANQTIALAASDSLDDVRAKIAANTTLAGSVDVSIDTTTVAGESRLKLAATSSKVDFTVQGSASSAALGLTSTSSTTSDNSGFATTGQSKSLLDNIIAAGGAVDDTLTLTSNMGGGAMPTTKTIQFGKGGAKVSTLAELSAAIASTGTISGGVTGTALTLGMSAGTGKSIGIAVNSAAVKTALGLNVARTDVNMTTGASRGGMGTEASKLSSTFNSDVSLGELDSTLADTGSTFSISVDKNDGNGPQVQTVGIAGTDRLSEVVTKLKGNATIAENLDVSVSGGKLQLKAKTSDVDFSVTNGGAAAVFNSDPQNVAVDDGTMFAAGAGASSNLLDNLIAAGGAENQTLSVAANGGTPQVITFGKGEGKVSTLADLKTELGKLTGGVTASVTGTTLNIGVASGAKQTSLVIGGDTKVLTQLGLTAGNTSGTKTVGDPSTTRDSLQKDFNAVLDQIDTLAKDASYNGNNLLNGDDLKVTFNENGSSSLTIQGVNFDSNNLGMNKQNGDQFQSNDSIDSVIASADKALNSLRTQASKFGSTLTTVQTRQDFTKNMINTLQTGADSLVLADTNEEGANLLALQTRQQLSTTALSMANQASQAVLRLF